MSSRFILLQSKLSLDLSSNIGRERCADVRQRIVLHDVDIAASLADGLDGIEHLGLNGLHLLARGLLESLLVILEALPCPAVPADGAA